MLLLPRVVLAVCVALVVALPVSPMAAATEGSPDPTACEDLARQLIAKAEAKVADLRQRASAFQEQQAAERRTFEGQAHTPEETQRFQASQADAAKRFYGGLWSEFVGAMSGMVQTYQQQCGSYEAQAFRTWQKPEPPVPEAYRNSAAQSPTTQTREACAQPVMAEAAQPADGSTAPSAQPEAQPAPSCPPPPPPERNDTCAGVEERLRARLDEAMKSLAAEKQAFAEEQAQAWRAWSAQEHTEDEGRAFAERQAQLAFERQKEWQARVETFHQALRRDYEAQCKPAYGEPAMPTARPQAACAGDVSAWEHERIAFEEGMRAKRAAFESEWRARWQAVEDGQASEADRAAFKESATKARIAFEDAMRQEYEAWAKAHVPPMACRPVMVTEGCDGERMRLETQAYEQHLRERYLGTAGDFGEFQARMQLKLATFEQAWKEERAAFAAKGEHTSEEWTAFEARHKAAFAELQAAMDAERRGFEERMKAAGHDLELKLRGEMERFLQSQAERCWGKASPARPEPVYGQPAQPVPVEPKANAVRASWDDGEQQRMRCVVDVKLKLQEFASHQLHDLEAFLGSEHSDALARFELAQEDARAAFEQRVQALRAACEDGLRAKHVTAIAVAQKDAAPRERMGSFQMEMDEGKGEVVVRGAHVAFKGDKATEALFGYTVDGQLFFDAVRKPSKFTGFDTEDGSDGTIMTMRGEGFLYRVHDHASGLANFRVSGAPVELDVADYLSVKRTDKGVEITDGQRRALLLGHALDVDGDRITLRGDADFLLEGQKQEVLAKVANVHRGDIAKAVTDKRIGAEVTLVAGADGTAAEKLTYQDMAIAVEKPKADGAVSVRIDSPTHEGKTVVLNLDKGLLASLLNLKIKVFEVEGGSESDASATKASSLADVLDPADDATPEYWIVTDEDGAQVLVSFPHFSEKRVEIQSGSSSLVKGLPGFEALAVLAALGVAFVVSRRKP